MIKKLLCAFKKSSEELKYPSGELLLSVIQKEYDYELTRKTTLESRAGIVLTLSISILTFIVTNINIDKLFLLDTSKVDAVVLITLFLIITLIAICSIVTSIFFLIRVLLTYEYRRLELKDFNKEYGVYEKDIIAMALTEEYRNVVSANQKVNNDKTNFYKIGVYSAISLVISAILMYILSLNM
ncbi:hypothetical protein [Sutcliffiella horikoshii]|uniref:Uncharacterized protein n=1 Tax=Sutcliffiella horikoshii TaxID=79883 RepID=A0A5D4SV30_9BACI|nr:hypothetical protein [Sutcliffiella horikoshii]TYS67277.1 hypothetical protein FZC75_19565 [Sutcliffiella horikoshii]